MSIDKKTLSDILAKLYKSDITGDLEAFSPDMTTLGDSLESRGLNLESFTPQAISVGEKYATIDFPIPDNLPNDLNSRIQTFLWNWVKGRFPDTKLVISMFDDLKVSMALDDFTDYLSEAYVRALRRNPKTNAITTVYKCVGGIKHGRKVADPKTCSQPVDLKRRANMKKNMLRNKAKVQHKKALTRLNNLAYKRARLANSRLKKATMGK